MNVTTQWLDMNPFDLPVVAIKAWILLRGGKKDEAERLLKPHLNEPDLPVLFVLCQSMILQQRRDFVAQREFLEAKGLSHASSSLAVTQAYVNGLIELGDFDAAESFLDQSPMKDDQATLRARLAFARGEAQEAIRFLEEHMKSRENDALACQQLIYYLTLVGDEEKQIEWSLEFSKRFPDHQFGEVVDTLLFEHAMGLRCVWFVWLGVNP